MKSTAAGVNLVLRTSVNPLSVVSAVSRQVTGPGKDQPVYNVATMDRIVASSMAERRFSMLLLGVFAAVALLLAGVGIYGVISYSVGQRVHEIGIRMALGAEQRDVLKLVVRQGFELTFVGIAVGLAGALALTHLMSSLLYGVRPTDVTTFAAVSLTLTFVALAASYVPARRATKVDPMVALRYE
jgi:putative ABC transport system permease protein